MISSYETRFKIGVCGSHGVGKTTLIRALETELLEAKVEHTIATEVPRLVCEKTKNPKMFLRGNNSLEKQLLLLIGQAGIEVRDPQDSKLVICDRTTIDHWVYTTTLFKDRLQMLNIDDMLKEFVEKYSKSYDMIIYLPIEFPVQADTVREDDVNFQKNIDSNIQKALKKFNLPRMVIRGTVEERVTEVRSFLKERDLWFPAPVGE